MPTVIKGENEIELAENTIIETLRVYTQAGLLKGVKVEDCPGDIFAYQFTNAKGTILVRYDNSVFTKPQTLGAVVQDETMEFSVIAHLQFPKKHSEIYPYLAKIKKVLTGLCVNGGKLWVQSRKYIGNLKTGVIWGFTCYITVPSGSEEKEDWSMPDD
jgi:hypothetical protein